MTTEQELIRWAVFIFGSFFLACMAFFLLGFAVLYVIVRVLGRPDPIDGETSEKPQSEEPEAARV